MWYHPLDKDEAITRMVRFKNIIYDDAKNNRITSELYKRADDTENSIRKDSTRLYEIIVNCTVVGDTRKSLKENVKTFKKHLKRYGGHFSAVSAKQAAMLLEGFGKKLLLTVAPVQFCTRLHQLTCWRFQMAYPWGSTWTPKVQLSLILGNVPITTLQ
ncbi:MAG: hypothetical protein ACR2LL_00405 [Nitrosopumilus sp.]